MPNNQEARRQLHALKQRTTINPGLSNSAYSAATDETQAYTKAVQAGGS